MNQPPTNIDLTPSTASELGRVLLRVVQTEYPHKLDHILFGPGDVRAPRAIHPAFYGCFDWHSAVHSHWALARLLNAGLQDNRAEALKVLARHLSPAHIAAELTYFETEGRESFERPYGWVWLLTLAAELANSSSPELRTLADQLRPLERAVLGRLTDYLTSLSSANRGGLHSNTGFALGLLWDYADRADRQALRALVAEKAIDFYFADFDAPIVAEPGQVDFLSPSLVEADLMRRVLSQEEFLKWFEAFLPSFDPNLLKPVGLIDRNDLMSVHLDGLNLSRAWCLRAIARALGDDHPIASGLNGAAESHAQAGLDHVVSGNFNAEHWLPTFAVYLATKR